jgi:hypothetical protein
LHTICPGWLWTEILLISASWVVRIIDVSHQFLAYWLLSKVCHINLLYNLRLGWILYFLLYFTIYNHISFPWQEDENSYPTISINLRKILKARDLVQVVECLPRKCKVLSSNPNTDPHQKKTIILSYLSQYILYTEKLHLENYKWISRAIILERVTIL